MMSRVRFTFQIKNKKSVIDRYLKGISIAGLALQLDCTSQIIQQILFNKGIEVVDQNQPKRLRKIRNRKS